MFDDATIRNSGRRFILIFLLIILIAGTWFLFLRNDEIDAQEASDLIVGEWIRTDGPYTIKIIELEDKGGMQAEYYNPGAIHVGRSEWRVSDGELQVYVKLQDKNYPGSTYELRYLADKQLLSGTYYQAVDRQTYKVEFAKK